MRGSIRVRELLISHHSLSTDERKGLGLTKTAHEVRVEAMSRGVVEVVVPGGSEDVMMDLGACEALKLSRGCCC